MKHQIKRLLETSKEVIKGCSIKNGAIIASNSSDKDTNNYKFVWPRDASYICIAANLLGIKIQEGFFKWCMNAEGWNNNGLFYKQS